MAQKTEVCILTGSLIDPARVPERKIGGVEIYTYSLAKAMRARSIPVSILQCAPRRFECELDIGVKVMGMRYATLKRWVADHPQALSVLADHSFVTVDTPRVDLFVQHGVYWDGFLRRFDDPLRHSLHILKHRLFRWQSFRVLKAIGRQSQQILTVDTNFQNWYRGLWPWDAIDNKCVYIPNFAFLHPREKAFAKWRDTAVIRIVFARRFTSARGTLIWARVAGKILQEFPQVVFLMAGDGEDKVKMQQLCPPSERVAYRMFTHGELTKELLSCHISVVPTLFCEGTSLALLESMAAGCACIATPIGGLPNILRDGINGLMCPPDSDRIGQAVRQLLNDLTLCERLARAGWETVQENHTEEQWAQRVGSLVQSMM